MTELPTTIHVINLDSSTERLAGVDASHRCHMAGTNLSRFPAMAAAEAESARIGGRCSWAEKGCYMSHVQCITANRESNEHLWLTEDDVSFRADTLGRLRTTLSMASHVAWDILFTHIEFGNDQTMPLSETPVSLARLDDSAFFGTSSYLVNRTSIAKVLGAVSRQQRINLAWDMFLKWCSATRRLDVIACVPDITGLSVATSQIQPSPRIQTR